MNGFPIGIFDSGLGGTSVWKAIHNMLLGESTLYLADSKNAPYGGKTETEIITLSVKNTEWLLEKGCKLIVVACNTATTTAIAYLRAHYEVPFIGIEPAVKPAALKSNTKVIGVLATQSTLNSGLFHKTSTLYGSGVKVIEQPGVGLVRLIEKGEIGGGEMRKLLRTYLLPMIESNIDRLVLGCTHYTYLIPEIRRILPNRIAIVDSGEAVARQTKAVLEKNGLLNTSGGEITQRFYSNNDPELLSRFLCDVDADMSVDFLDF